ncbi:bifunctional phosphoribosyl-AMP cyclohydrolase/phosphoribosyl-ATP pyrophosphatase [Ammoniphilus oxalaticus]|uniref:Histidine biosynthesis bifunctional protein HisIE n=1 Tax=Ammoniphilus oxalaticus TaxID=66863 RepID=A0A419SF03_9BACL|nr:bifunctional phosphoribosyl-AMP cyclohydrolase/phosphoribosyl-ATP diphosphatase HisIE [Ammoniphilus oxalaticus]RKD21804.1 bifunctional phosphoribosyl-AMP cyclohydrolase/phosphoribosyl-ATP pyrophosphatase [Ammoniphilus oxalaticus]
MKVDWEKIKFDESGLIPTVVQDAQSKEVLMMAYMNKESLQKTIESGQTWFWSRSRQQLWHKGATSGNTQQVNNIALDCDGDTLLIKVEPAGPACHENTYSCFRSLNGESEPMGSDRFNIIANLETLIAKRHAERPEGAYTTYLFEEGVDKILKKVGEEASEVIIAAKNRDHDELRYETSDLIYHLLVLLREQQLSFDEVLNELSKRFES